VSAGTRVGAAVGPHELCAWCTSCKLDQGGQAENATMISVPSHLTMLPWCAAAAVHAYGITPSTVSALPRVLLTDEVRVEQRAQQLLSLGEGAEDLR
jgi:hypothetical protein